MEKLNELSFCVEPIEYDDGFQKTKFNAFYYVVDGKRLDFGNDYRPASKEIYYRAKPVYVQKLKVCNGKVSSNIGNQSAGKEVFSYLRHGGRHKSKAVLQNDRKAFCNKIAAIFHESTFKNFVLHEN